SQPNLAYEDRIACCRNVLRARSASSADDFIFRARSCFIVTRQNSPLWARSAPEVRRLILSRALQAPNPLADQAAVRIRVCDCSDPVGLPDILKPNAPLPPRAGVSCSARLVRSILSVTSVGSGNADACAEMLRIGRDGQHRLRRRLEQQVVDERLVLERYVSDFGRQREHNMEIADRQQVASRSASHDRAAAPWQFGQCRLRQLL